MILTKEEFLKEFEYNSLPAVHRLKREGKIVVRDDGMIDTEAEGNREWCKKRREKLAKKAKGKTPQAEEKPTKKNQKPEAQINLELDILSQKYKQAEKQNKLLDLKITKEQGDTVSKEVLNRCIIAAFDSLFKTLAEFPNVYASEIINIVHSNDSPKEPLIDYLTGKILTELNVGVENAKKAVKKFYGDKNE